MAATTSSNPLLPSAATALKTRMGTMGGSLNGELLLMTLEVGVPIAIHELKRQGGPTEWERQRARDFAWVLGEKGDQLLYRDKKTASLMAQLIRAVAVLAFSPGGVRIGGVTFQAKVHDQGEAST